MIIVIFVLALIYPTYALYFHIGETEKTCFFEEIPDDTMVIGKFGTQLWDKQTSSFLPSTPGLGMHIEIRDPDRKVILSRQYGSDGRFIFTSYTPGQHQICLQSNSTKMALFAGGKLRVHLDIQTGEHTNNYTEMAEMYKLTKLQLRVRQVQLQVEQILKEQNYQRYREERFRMISQSTKQRILWWSMAQMVILIIFTSILADEVPQDNRALSSDCQEVPPQSCETTTSNAKIVKCQIKCNSYNFSG